MSQELCQSLTGATQREGNGERQVGKATYDESVMDDESVMERDEKRTGVSGWM